MARANAIAGGEKDPEELDRIWRMGYAGFHANRPPMLSGASSSSGLQRPVGRLLLGPTPCDLPRPQFPSDDDPRDKDYGSGSSQASRARSPAGPVIFI